MTEEKRKEKAYRAWDNLKRRHNFNHSFIVFFATVGAPLSEKHTLSRIVNTKPYTIDNLMWQAPLVYGKEKRMEAMNTKNDIETILNVSQLNDQNLND